MLQDPASTSVNDLCTEILREAGVLGMGQDASAGDISGMWARLQWMLQQWERKRWLVYRLVTVSKVSNGATSYTIGPGGDFDTGTLSVRPARIESAFVRQIQTPAPNQVDYPLGLLQSREDYNLISLKSMVSFPQAVFLDSAWPLGQVYVWPVPNANIYSIHLSVMAQLPQSFENLAEEFVLPYEYYGAMLYQGALRARSWKRIPSFPGDPLMGLAKDALNVLRGANTQIAQLQSPPGLSRGNQYNIFNDQFR